jgi:hypothetical protein
MRIQKTIRQMKALDLRIDISRFADLETGYFCFRCPDKTQSNQFFQEILKTVIFLKQGPKATKGSFIHSVPNSFPPKDKQLQSMEAP